MFCKFKEGDLVYNLNSDNSIHKVYINDLKHSKYPLLVTNSNGETDCYTEDGRVDHDSPLPTLIAATEENRKALTTIFGDIFQSVEKYKSTKSPFEIISHTIGKQGFAWCGVSDINIKEARESAENNLVKIIEASTELGTTEFYDSDGDLYVFAVPIDPNTGKEITDY